MPRLRKQNLLKGGNGAAPHVIGVVGGIGQQVAVPGSNVIAMRDANEVPIVAPVKGGALVELTPATIENAPAVVPVKGGAVLPLTPAPLNGGGVLQDVAAPAVLLLANNALKRTMRRKSKRGSKRSSKKRAFSRRRR